MDIDTKKIFLTTLGCKVNQYETAALKTAFVARGCELVAKDDPADIVVINTCAVTNKAGAQSRQAVRQAVRNNPEARIVITGCLAEVAGKQLAAIKELADCEFAVVGNDHKDTLVAEILEESAPFPRLQFGTIMSADTVCALPVRQFGGRTRAYLRVQDGCQSFCSYCIVPYTRGPSRSVPWDLLRQQVLRYVEEGYHEIVLTGIHLGYYGEDLAERCDITDLVEKLTAAFPAVRFRISSLEPLEITSRLLCLMKERANLMPHLHVPLQSGDDEILALMERRYSTEQFAEIIARCHEMVPGIAIGLDVMTGFPGETERHFANIFSFLKELPFSYLHVFPYSKRPGTKAVQFAGHLPKTVKKERVVELRQLSDKKKAAFYRQHLGMVLPVLVESTRDERGLLRGFSDNYIACHFPGEDELINRVVWVRGKEFTPIFLSGEVVTRDEN